MAEINHNETNYNGLRELQDRRAKLLKSKESEFRKQIQETNMADWVNSVPELYKKADLRFFSRRITASVMTMLKNKRLPYRTVIFGQSGSGRTFFLYGFLKLCIYSGLVTPNEIRIAGIREAADAISGGFQKQGWRDRFFDPRAKLIVIKGTSLEFTELGIKGSDRFLGEFTQFANENHISVVVLYETSIKEENAINSGRPFIPRLSQRNNLVASLLTNQPMNIHVTFDSHVSPDNR